MIELRGAGGEPVDFARTLLSHGVADLPPNRIAEDGSRLETVLPDSGGPRVVVVEPAEDPRFARVTTPLPVHHPWRSSGRCGGCWLSTRT